MSMERNHCVYILECRDGTLYTGYTVNIKERLKRHAEGKGAKYTRGRGPFTLRYQENFPTKSSALKREYEIKSWNRKKKWSLIREKGLGEYGYSK